MVDVVEVLEMHVHLGAGAHLLQRPRQHRQTNQGGRTVEPQVDPVVLELLLAPGDFEVREGVKQFEQRQPQANQHAFEQTGGNNRGDRHQEDRDFGLPVLNQLRQRLGVS